MSSGLSVLELVPALIVGAAAGLLGVEQLPALALTLLVVLLALGRHVRPGKARRT